MALEKSGNIRYSTLESRQEAQSELYGVTKFFLADNMDGRTTKEWLLRMWVRDAHGNLIFKGWTGDIISRREQQRLDLSTLGWKVAKFEIWWRKLGPGDPMWVVYESPDVSNYFLAMEIVWDAQDQASVYYMPGT